MTGQWKVSAKFRDSYLAVKELVGQFQKIRFIEVQPPATLEGKVLAEKALRDRHIFPGFQG